VAGPTILVRVLGDLSNLSKSFKDAESKAGAAGKAISGGLGSALAVVNKTGVLGPFGEALDSINTAIGHVVEHGKQIGPAMIGVGGALAGVGVGLAALGSHDQAAHQQLQASVEATGKSYDDYEKQVEQAIKSQEKFGHTANETQDALRILTQATNDPAKALQYLNTATDLAAAKHESLTEAAGQLGKAYNGAGRILKEFGLVAGPKAAAATAALATATKAAASADERAAAAKRRLADLEAIDATKKHLTVAEAIRLRDAQQKVNDTAAAASEAHKKLAAAQDTVSKSAHSQGDTMTALAGKLHGQASAAADTFSGKLAAIKAHLEDSAAQLGQKYGPALTAAGSLMAGLGAAVTTTTGIMKAFRGASEAATVAVEGTTAATEGLAVAEETADAAALPLLATVGLVVLAIAALGVAAYVIYRNWNTIWKAMKLAVTDVWDWIKTNWPLLLAIITGPFGLAVYFIVKNWGTIVDFFIGIFRWFQTTWGTVEQAVTAPFIAAFDWLAGAIATVGGWFKNLPHDIWSAVQTIANILIAPFKWAFDMIAWLWNNTVGRIGFKVPGWVPGIGGDSFQMPQVPQLAQGGLITGTGLVFAHAGEVIAPIDKVPRGPAIVINDAHFSSEVDIDLFMRRAAWAVQTTRI
jgi:hypothetical protein